jgi:hypothetical protein
MHKVSRLAPVIFALGESRNTSQDHGDLPR